MCKAGCDVTETRDGNIWHLEVFNPGDVADIHGERLKAIANG